MNREDKHLCKLCKAQLELECEDHDHPYCEICEEDEHDPLCHDAAMKYLSACDGADDYESRLEGGEYGSEEERWSHHGWSHHRGKHFVALPIFIGLMILGTICCVRRRRKLRARAAARQAAEIANEGSAEDGAVQLTDLASVSSVPPGVPMGIAVPEAFPVSATAYQKLAAPGGPSTVVTVIPPPVALPVSGRLATHSGYTQVVDGRAPSAYPAL